MAASLGEGSRPSLGRRRDELALCGSRRNLTATPVSFHRIDDGEKCGRRFRLFPKQERRNSQCGT